MIFNTQTAVPLADNLAWHALQGVHAGFSVGTQDARRYAESFPAIVGFVNPEQPNLAAMQPFCKVGESMYCSGWSGVAPVDWCVESESPLFQMVWAGAAPCIDAALQAVRLGCEHAAQALELASMTRPGPFGLRSLELGEYIGVWKGSRLIAMAGERMLVGGYREISAVCTHPDYQGQGLARRLVLKLLRQQLQRGETPFLHVLPESGHAHRLYERMGFVFQREVLARVIARIY